MGAKKNKKELAQELEQRSKAKPSSLVSEEAIELDNPDDSKFNQKREEPYHSSAKEQMGERNGKESVVRGSSAIRKKWIVLFIVVLGLIAGGFYASTKVEKIKSSLRAEEKVPMISNPVVVEKLAPFFIPLEPKPKDPSAIMARLDISVRWKRIVGIRFNESRYQIRAEIYNSLRDLLSKGSDPRKEKQVIEVTIGKAVNSGLGISGVQISSLDIELI